MLNERDAAKGREWSDLVLNAPVNQQGKLGKALVTHLAMRTAVYAIGALSNSPLKIGFSRRPISRLTDVQISSPIDIRFHLVCWLANKAEAVSLEQRCHQILTASGHHIRGEWFNLTPLDAAKVIDRASIDVKCHMVPHKELVRRFPSSQDPLAGYFWGDAR